VASRLNKVRGQFERRIDEAEDFVARCCGARHATAERRALARANVEWAYETALLKLVIGSEQFFEDSLGLYVTGVRTDSGYRPRRLKRLDASLAHTLEVLRGDQEFIGWSDPNIIIGRAQRWLRGGEPFYTPLSAASQLLAFTKKMRNVVAHESESAAGKYARATRGLYGALPARLAPGAQLAGPPPPGIAYLTGPTLFKAAADTYRLLARSVVK
jgi:hypothetical protein